MRHIKIVKTKENKVASLEIDGKPAKTDVLERLQFVGVELPSDELPTVTFKYRPSEVDIEIELEELTSLEETIFAEETESQAKTFMGFELVDADRATKIVDALHDLGNEPITILRRLYKDNLIKRGDDRKQAFMLLQNADDIAENVKQFLHEDFHGNKVIKDGGPR